MFQLFQLPLIRRMLQPLFLDVSKVDRVLHLSFRHLLLHLAVGSMGVTPGFKEQNQASHMCVQEVHTYNDRKE